jgi:hypothetical protein
MTASVHLFKEFDFEILKLKLWRYSFLDLSVVKNRLHFDARQALLPAWQQTFI